MWSNPVWRYMQWQSYYNSNPSKLTFFFEIMSKMSFLKRLERSYLKKICIFYLSIQIFTYPKQIFGFLFLFHSFNHFFIHSFVRFLIHTFVHSFNHSFILWFIDSFLRSFIPFFIRSFIRSFIHFLYSSFIHSFFQLFIYSFVCSFIHSFIHGSIHPFICYIDSFLQSMHSFVCLFIYRRPLWFLQHVDDPERAVCIMEHHIY